MIISLLINTKCLYCHNNLDIFHKSVASEREKDRITRVIKKVGLSQK